MKLFLKIILLKPIYNGLILLMLIIPGHSLGWAIIIMTMIIRLLLIPSTNSATRAQKKMRRLQPEIEKIKQQYKGDQAGQGRATMALYKKYGVNPVGSCLPVLIQFPVLIILYYALSFITSEGHRLDLLYAWVPRPETFQTNFFGIELGQPEKWFLPISAGVLQFVSAWQMQPPKTKKKEIDMTAALTKQMLYMFPLLTIWIARSFPAALPLYWVVSTLFTIVQQKIILSKKNGEKAVGAAEGVEKYEFKAKGKGGVEVTVRKKN